MLRGYSPTFSSSLSSSSSSSSALSLPSQKPNDGVDSAKPFSNFKFDSPAVTVGNPDRSSYTQTGPQQTAEKVMNFEKDTGLKLNDIKSDIKKYYSKHNNPSEAAQKAFDAIFERLAQKKAE
jgi:hypothetical protein